MVTGDTDVARKPNGNASTVSNCSGCPLRKRKWFRMFTGPELSFVENFKTGELAVAKGATILSEGSPSPHLYTVTSGWGFRYKFMDDGRRQILNYIMPGDIVGLQGGLMDEMQHSVEALSEMRLCVFERTRLMELYRKHPELAYDVTWIAAAEERMLDEHLLSVGRRTALERSAYLLVFLHRRARVVELLKPQNRIIPVTQTHVADTLGLSVVHTNKTLRKIAKRGLVKWHDRGCEVLDEDTLLSISKWPGEFEDERPFI